MQVRMRSCWLRACHDNFRFYSAALVVRTTNYYYVY